MNTQRPDSPEMRARHAKAFFDGRADGCTANHVRHADDICSAIPAPCAF